MRHNSLLQRALNENDLVEFQKLVKKGFKLKTFIIEILKCKLKDFASLSLDHPNWAIKRAFDDGRRYEIQFLLDLLDHEEK